MMSHLSVEYVSLSEYIGQPSISNASLRRHLRSFTCEADRDVQEFFRRYAYGNERNGSTRTYLAIDRSRSDETGQLAIVAYCSVALTITDFRDADPSMKRRIVGNVLRVEERDSFPGYLIAQIGRDSRYSHREFDAAELLQYAEERVLDAVRVVGGTAVYLDCKESEPLMRLYGSHGYEVLFVGEGDHPVKMVKSLRMA